MSFCTSLYTKNANDEIKQSDILKSGLSVFFVIKQSASSRRSLGPNSAWGSIETTTIGKTHPTLDLNIPVN